MQQANNKKRLDSYVTWLAIYTFGIFKKNYLDQLFNKLFLSASVAVTIGLFSQLMFPFLFLEKKPFTDVSAVSECWIGKQMSTLSCNIDYE